MDRRLRPAMPPPEFWQPCQSEDRPTGMVATMTSESAAERGTLPPVPWPVAGRCGGGLPSNNPAGCSSYPAGPPHLSPPNNGGADGVRKNCLQHQAQPTRALPSGAFFRVAYFARSLAIAMEGPMGGVCNYCDGEFPGAGPGTKWPHDTELCLRKTFKQQKAQLEDIVMCCWSTATLAMVR